MKYPNYIMRAIRQEFFGLDEEDTSKDVEIESMEPAVLFGSWLNWEGIQGYTGLILDTVEVLYNCDLETREFNNEERCY